MNLKLHEIDRLIYKAKRALLATPFEVNGATRFLSLEELDDRINNMTIQELVRFDKEIPPVVESWEVHRKDYQNTWRLWTDGLMNQEDCEQHIRDCIAAPPIMIDGDPIPNWPKMFRVVQVFTQEHNVKEIGDLKAAVTIVEEELKPLAQTPSQL